MPSWSYRKVPGVGPHDARIVVIGEAPGEQEDKKGRPFEGHAGRVFEQYLATVGLSRKEMYIDNVFPFRPHMNKIESVPRDVLELWMADLHQRLGKLVDPWVLVPMGNYALYALLKLGRVYWHTRDGKTSRPGIKSLRGTVFEYTDIHGRKIKCIPTIHPAATFRERAIEQACIIDWFKIAREAQTREIIRPKRHLEIRPSLQRVQEYANEVLTGNGESLRPLAIDIENPQGPIVCVGLSNCAQHAISIPTTEAYWGNNLEEIWEIIRVLYESLEIDKITQNGIYDCYVLAWERGIWPVKWTFDTLAMHHCIHAAAYAHSLEYMASIWTDEPYWKDEGKSHGEGRMLMWDINNFYTYNAKDAVVTWELHEKFKNVLVGQGLWEFYERHYAGLFYPILRLSLAGIRVNDAQRRRRAAECLAQTIELQDKIAELAGESLHARKSLSDAKIRKYLYETLRLPKQLQKRGKGEEKTESAGEVAIRKLMLKFPGRLDEVGKLILDHRRVKKLSEYFAPKRIDDDGRQRAQYWMNTEEGRLKSKTTPLGTGSNLQNIDRDARDMYLADEGCIGVKVDQSQAEARYVDLCIFYLTGNKAYRDRAFAKPWERDTHRETAAVVFGVDEREVTDEQRQIAKSPRHALPRGMAGEKLQEVLLKAGYVRTVEECQGYLDAIMAKEPEHRDYFKWIENSIAQNRRLVNSWGRELLFPYDRLDSTTYQRGYSFIPQSECADLQNQQGLIPMDSWFLQYPAEYGRINVHNHDELFFSVIPELAYEAAKFLVDSIGKPHRIFGLEFSMPVEVSIGRSWKTTHKWKKFPEREEFEQAVDEVMRKG